MYGKELNREEINISCFCHLEDSPGDDAGDRLWPRWHRVTGGVDPGRHDHHPAARPAGPWHGQSTRTLKLWDTRAPRHWHLKTLGHWDIGKLEHLNDLILYSWSGVLCQRHASVHTYQIVFTHSCILSCQHVDATFFKSDVA